MEGSATPILTVDAHLDCPWQYIKHGCYTGNVIPDAMKQGGLDKAVFALYLPDSWQDSLGPEASWNSILHQHNWARGRGQNLFCLEGGRLLNNDPVRIARLKTGGVVYVTVTHNRNTEWADSATDTHPSSISAQHNGLTKWGVHMIRNLQSSGILVDVSHASDKTTEAVVGESWRPVIASHSGCRALVNHPRNLSDGLIRQIAGSGGVIGVPFVKRFIGSVGLGAHIDHIADLLGNTNHIGIGSDIDGAVLVDEFEGVETWRDFILTELDDYKFSSRDQEKILGDNWTRVFDSTI